MQKISAGISHSSPHSDTSKEQTPSTDQRVKLICIGTSTGGPRALRAVISKLPGHLPVPVVVVQHMPAAFTKPFAEKLNQWASLSVQEARHGELLQSGKVYIAPGGHQTRINRVGQAFEFNVDQSPPIRGLRPSFDVLLESVAANRIENVITVTLTGMGSDGARGLTELKKVCHVYSIAESETTAVIFGMPKAVIKTGLVDEIVDLEDIPSAIQKRI